MREAVSQDSLRAFMRELAMRSRAEGRVYITGGGSAVLLRWREKTVDVDVTIIPESNAVLSAIRDLKDELNINVEFASPRDFIPELPGWQERSKFIAREGKLDFFHYDFYAQCLAKIERGHRKDLADVQSMLNDGLVEKPRLGELFAAIEPELLRYPAIDARDFRRRVESTIAPA